MPYDVKITHDPDNTDPKAKYRLIGSPAKDGLSEAEQTDFSEHMKKLTPEDYVAKRKAKVKDASIPEYNGGIKYPTEEISPEDITFDQ